MENLVIVKNLTKNFGKNEIFSNLNFHIKKGEVYGLIGNNGVGKTTLLKMICGLLNKTDGEIIFSSGETCDIGALIESPGIYTDMSAFDNLKAKALCLGIKHAKADLEEILNFVGLSGAKKKKAGKFSMGMKQRLGIALALLGDPELLILDEPTNSLDPQVTSEIRKLIQEIHEKKNKTVLISSHFLDELVKVATRFIIMYRGKIIKEMTTEELLNECGKMSIDEYYVKILADYDNSFNQ